MSSNQLDMFQLIKIKSKNNGIAREARRKFFARGGTKLLMGGDSKFFGWGGTGLDGGGLPLDGGGSPPIPPHIGQPWGVGVSKNLTTLKVRKNEIIGPRIRYQGVLQAVISS